MQIVQKITGEDDTLTQISKNLLVHKKSPFKAMGFGLTCSLVEQVLTAGIHQEQSLANVFGNLIHIHSPFISTSGRFLNGGLPNQKSGVFYISLSIELSVGSNRRFR